jgi:hypothetical protein
MIFGAENPIQLARFRAVALAEGTLLCKAKQRRSRWSSADESGRREWFWRSRRLNSNSSGCHSDGQRERAFARAHRVVFIFHPFSITRRQVFGSTVVPSGSNMGSRLGKAGVSGGRLGEGIAVMASSNKENAAACYRDPYL